MNKTIFKLYVNLLSITFMLVSTIVVFGQSSELVRVETPIPGQYIVVLNDNAFHGIETCVLDKEGEKSNLPEGVESRESPLVAEYVNEFAREYGVEVTQVYGCALKGFAANMSEEKALEILNDYRVSNIEENSEISIDTTQYNAPWGLDRIDRRLLPLNGQYRYSPTIQGTAEVYIIDTGILPTHSEFGGRARVGVDVLGGNGIDCNSHGTHVAGIIGGKTYGVAKGVMLIGVKVFDCSGRGSVADVVAGVNWVAARRGNSAIVNMSLGFPSNSSTSVLDTAVNNAIKSGKTVVVSAGNDIGRTACRKTPARVPDAITVGSTGKKDKRSAFSNIGNCIDIFAPGEDIISSSASGNDETVTYSGTSQAAPHVAGVAALFLERNPYATSATVTDYIIRNATNGIITNVGDGSPNRLLFLDAPSAHCTDPVYYFNGTYINATYDSINCYVKPFPPNTTPFVWNNSYYTQTIAGSYSPDPNKTCPTNTTWDGMNCLVLPFPVWNPTHFVWSNNLYLTAGQPGNVCPSGSQFDGMNCYIMPMPPNTSAFKWGNNLYITPPPYCPEGFYDGANCYIGTAPSGTTAFVWGPAYYYAE